MGTTKFFGIVEDLDYDSLQQLLDDFPGMSDKERRCRAAVLVLTFAPDPSEVAVQDVLASELFLMELILIDEPPRDNTISVHIADVMASALIKESRCPWHD